MLLLCLDTATPQVSAAIGADGAVLGEIRLGRGRRHAEHLAPAIEYLCRELDVELARLSAIAVGLGPGLFTGLRVGVTTAKTMAQVLRVPVVGVASLDLVAYPLRHVVWLCQSFLARLSTAVCALCCFWLVSCWRISGVACASDW